MADYKARLEGLEERIVTHLEEKKSRIPGLAIGIYQGDRQIYFQGIGHAHLATRTPITPTTVFRLASISKVFTTIGIMQLRDQGKFQLDDPVNNYLPNGKVLKRHPNWPEVTFRHLLTHRSGIGELPKKSDLFKAPGFGMNIKWPAPIKTSPQR
jgi:CubicO group peptidase (beta-lactamase class C family)